MQPKVSNHNSHSLTKPATKAGDEALAFLEGLDGEHLVAAGLSGGVDSSLTAALLVNAGWKVEGITLWLMSGKGSCCADGLIDAAGICEQLGIPHHIVDKKSKFENEVVKTLVEGYQKGITPLPCSRCNRSVKFAEMTDWAKKNRQISRIATGHYARIEYAQSITSSCALEKPQDRHKLLRGIDRKKDQSYFLYDLSQEILGKIVFPLGGLTKTDTRKEASNLGLRTAQKEESQDLCLSELHGSMKAFLDKYLPPRIGDISLLDGTVIGKHDGIEHFTIGQRKGLGVSWNEPLHVVRIESSNNRVFVAPRSQAATSKCVVGSVNWVSIFPPQKAINVEVQLRYRSAPVIAELIPIKETADDISNKRPHRCQLFFQEKQFSVTPGQAAVFYADEILLGGGIIQT